MNVNIKSSLFLSFCFSLPSGISFSFFLVSSNPSVSLTSHLFHWSFSCVVFVTWFSSSLKCKNWGAPWWLSWLSVGLQLRSWSHNEFEHLIRLCTSGAEPTWDSIFLSLSLSLPIPRSLSFKINKLKKMQKLNWMSNPFLLFIMILRIRLRLRHWYCSLNSFGT